MTTCQQGNYSPYDALVLFVQDQGHKVVYQLLNMY